MQCLAATPPPPPPFTLAPYTNYRPFRPFLFNLAELLKGRITLFTRYITIQWTSSVDVVAAPVVVVVVAVFFFPYRFPQIFSAFLSYHKCNVTSLTDLISVYVTVLTYLKFVDHSTNQKIQRCKKHQYSKTKINRPPHRAMQEKKRHSNLKRRRPHHVYICRYIHQPLRVH